MIDLQSILNRGAGHALRQTEEFVRTFAGTEVHPDVGPIADFILEYNGLK